jgi:hypothetical protein
VNCVGADRSCIVLTATGCTSSRKHLRILESLWVLARASDQVVQRGVEADRGVGDVL